MSSHVQHNRKHELSLLFHETISILSPSLGQKELLSEPDPHPEVKLLPVTSTHAQTCAHAQLFLQLFFHRLYVKTMSMEKYNMNIKQYLNTT